jgi:hypothetical protein
MEEKIETQQPDEPKQKMGFGSRVKQLLRTKRGKALAGLALFVVVLLVLLAIPQTRYAVYGQLFKKDITVVVANQQTGMKVSDVEVVIGSLKGKTDKDGKVVVKQVPAGQYKVALHKQYYAKKEVDVTLPLLANPDTIAVKLTAEGKQVEITIVDAISKQSLANVQLAGGGVSGVTNNQGVASVVLPSKAQKHTLKLGRDGYNDKSADIILDPKAEIQKITLDITPKGAVVYLSKATGKINVMRANLDGSGPTVVVAGTGNEDDRTTALLSTRDWQFSLLQARRTGQSDALYLVNNFTGELTLVDEGKVYFELAGWSGHTFTYKMNRQNVESWTDKASAIKLYNADSKTLTIVDETRAAGSSYYDYRQELISTPYILENEIVYLKWWSFGQYAEHPADTKASIMTVNPSNRLRKTAHTFDQQDNGMALSYRLYRPQELYIALVRNYDYERPEFYEYEDGKVSQAANVTTVQYDSRYPTYLISPTGKKSLWFEERDGRNIIFIGDKNGENQKQIATTPEYKPYGWYGDDDRYVLLSKDNSQLYIASPDQLGTEKYQPLKITDYHRPTTQYLGYGYGYGGL